MYIRLEGNEHLLIRTIEGTDGTPKEVILANLGQDPELNLFLAADRGRRDNPEVWEGVSDFHLLQAWENYKRRLGRFRPSLVVIEGKGQTSDQEE